jgi:hypothetical protein
MGAKGNYPFFFFFYKYVRACNISIDLFCNQYITGNFSQIFSTETILQPMGCVYFFLLKDEETLNLLLPSLLLHQEIADNSTCQQLLNSMPLGGC